MIKSMRGIRKEYQYPVLKRDEEVAISDEKAEMIAKELVKIISSHNLSEEAKRGRMKTRAAHPGVLERRHATNSVFGCSIYSG